MKIMSVTMESVGVTNMHIEAILKEFVNLFEECDNNTGKVPVAVIIEHITSSVQKQCSGGIEELVGSILGHLDGVLLLSKTDFIDKVREYLLSVDKDASCREVYSSVGTGFDNSYSDGIALDQPEMLTPREPLPVENIRKSMLSTELELRTQDETDTIKNIENCAKTMFYSSDNNENESVFIYTMDRLFDEKKKFEALYNKQHTLLQKAEETNAKLVQEKNQILLSLEDIKVREKEVEQQFDEVQEELKRKEGWCAALNRRLADETEALAKERQKCEELLEELKRKADCCAGLAQQVTAAHKENELLKGSATELERRIDLQGDQYNACKNALQKCQMEILTYESKIETLEKEKLAIEEEWLMGIDRLKEMSSSYQELELENSMLKDSQKSKLELCDASLDITIEDSFGNISNVTDPVSSPQQLSIVGSGTRNYQESILSLKDEMEAEGEFNCDSYSNYELMDKVEQQQRTIASLMEMVEKEKERHTRSSETLDNCKRQLSDYEKKITVLEKEKQEVMAKLMYDCKRLPGLTRSHQGDSSECSNEGRKLRLGLSSSDPELVQKIEQQQTVIHSLVQKISEKFITKSSSHSSVLPKFQRICWNLILIFFLASTLVWLLQWMMRDCSVRTQRPFSYYGVEELMQPYLYMKWEKPPPI